MSKYQKGGKSITLVSGIVDENSKIGPDLRKDYGEERWKIIGNIYGSIISVIYTVRNKVTRIISARKASSAERKEYNNK